MFRKSIYQKNSFCKLIYRKLNENDSICKDPASYISFKIISNQEIRIESLGVKKEFRRNNLGEFMIQNVIKLSNLWKIKFITLHVMIKNQPAQKLYSKNGFKTLKWISKYYNQETDALMMIFKNE